jgi:putative transposase
MQLLDEQYLQTPQYGYCKMQIALLQAGYCVNHKRVHRLMQTLGIEAIYPKMNTSKPGIGHRINRQMYGRAKLYLLRQRVLYRC